jgi:hypothetical protein
MMMMMMMEEDVVVEVDEQEEEASRSRAGTTRPEPPLATTSTNTNTTNMTNTTNTTNTTNPDASTWRRLYRAYRRAVTTTTTPKGEEDGRTENDDDDDDENDPWLGDFIVPYQVQYRPDKGRGVFSAADTIIAKGAVVLVGYSAVFGTEEQWRTFLSLLPLSLARDVATWAYVVDDDGRHYVMLDLHPGSLINHGDTKEDDDTTRTAGDDAMMMRHNGGTTITANLVESYLLEGDKKQNDDDDDDEKQMMQMIATMASASSQRRLVPNPLGGGSYYWFRASCDIYPGDEFLTDYTIFHVHHHTLDWFDTLRRQLVVEDHDFRILSLD